MGASSWPKNKTITTRKRLLFPNVGLHRLKIISYFFVEQYDVFINTHRFIEMVASYNSLF